MDKPGDEADGKDTSCHDTSDQDPPVEVSPSQELPGENAPNSATPSESIPASALTEWPEDAALEAMAAFLGIPLPAARMASVRGHLDAALAMAQLVYGVELEDERRIPAPVFQVDET